MLQIIRERAQGIVAWTFVIFITLTIAMWGSDNYSIKSTNGVAATVNGQKITWEQVDNLSKQYLQYLSLSNAKFFTQINSEILKQQALKDLVMQVAFNSQTQRLNLLISDEQLIHKISTDSTFQEDGNFSTDRYKLILRQAAQSEEDYERKLHMQMIKEQLKGALVASSFMVDAEIERIMSLWLQKRDFGYVIVPVNRFFTIKRIPQYEVEKYYQQHQGTFVVPEQVQLSYVQLDLNELGKTFVADEQILQDFYERHKASYVVAEEVHVRHILITALNDSDAEKSGEARAKIDDLLMQIKLNADFESLAKKYSEDIDSALKGGDIGHVGRGQVVKSFENIAFGLENPYEVSEVVQTESGYHIIQLLSKKKAYTKPFETVKMEVELYYRREEAEHQFLEKCEELANLAFENPESLKVVAESTGLSIKETGFFGRGGGDDIGNVQEVVEVAFQRDMINQIKNSDLVCLDAEHYIVFRVKNYLPARSQTLEEVHSDIEVKLQDNKAAEQAKALGEEILAALMQGEAPYKLSKMNRLEWVSQKDIKRTNNDVNPVILQEVFELPKPNRHQFSYKGFTLSNGDYAVLSLSTVHEDISGKNRESKLLFKSQVVSALGQFEYQLYEMGLINQVDFKFEQLPN